jgi:hypothetical protein
MYFEGDSNDKFTVLGHGIASFANTYDIHEFWNHLFFFNYTDTEKHCRSLLYSVAGDVDDFTTEGSAGGTTLTDTKGEIVKAVPLGTALVIYSQHSITMCRYFGGATLFSFPTLIYETGILAKEAVWGSTNVHFFLGTDQRVYAYYGETDIKPIGEAVEKRLFGDIFVTNKSYVCNGLDVGRHKVLFGIPTAGLTYPKYIYAFNYRDQELTWEHYSFADSVMGFGLFTNYIDWWCDGMPFYKEVDSVPTVEVYCDESPAFCDSGYGQTGYSKMCFISSDGYVFQVDEALGSDNGSDIEFKLQTPDFTGDAEETFCRWQWFSFVAKADLPSSTVSVHYSTDGGTTWSYIDLVTLTDTWDTYRLPIDVLARRIRFMIYQNGTKDVKVRGLFKCKTVPQTERD